MKHLMNKTSKKTWAWILAVVMTLSIVIPTSLLTAKAEVTAPTFSEAAGWFESAYAEWTSKGATQYKAYVKEAGAADSTYVQIDDELIRNYGDYWRVDAVGLKAGSYQIKVVASDGSKEANKVTDVLTVSAYDRTGFAWVDGTASGAYNEDGTLKSNAVVLYLTEDTKDTMTLDVVTSSKGATTACTGIVEILAAYKKGYDARPLDIRVIGKVTNEGKITSDKDSKGDIVVSGSSSSKRLSCGVTVEGIGEDATAYGWGLRIKNCSNVEVRNIGFMMCDSDEGDNVGLQQDNDHVWVHNCDMFYGQAGGDSDQAKGDGALDCKLSTYVTFSYNHFWDNGKCNLLGLKEGTTEGYYITYHHNWYDHSDSRHPRCRYYSAHVYNNYYDGNAKYGIGSTLGSSVFAEGNYFRNCQYPILTSMQGSDVFAGGTSRDIQNNATFSKEAGGTIKAFNNIMTGNYTFIPYGSSTYTLKGTQTAFNLDGTSSTADFDAVVVSSASEKIDSSVKSYTGSNTYNNFDTSSSMYSYTADAPEDVPSIVTATAGRMNGGDFSWTFNNEVDDESYAVNAELKAALQSYKSSVKSIGGSVNKSEDTTKDTTADTTAATTKADETTSATSTTKAEETTTAGQSGTAGVYVQNFTTDGTSSSFFTISGNLATNKGTVTYNGLTLTQCLKLESSTNIEFTAPSEGTLTLVLNSDFSKNVKIDGNKVAATNGIVTKELSAGKHTVTKGDTANLYYMTFATEGSTTETTTAKETEATTKETETTTKETETTAKETEAPTQAPGSDDNGKYDSTSADYSGAYTNISTKKDSDFANAKYVSSSEEILNAIATAKAGDVIIVREGTYSFTSDGAAAIVIDNAKNGSENAYIILKAEEGKNVKFDFSAQSLNSANRGLVVDGDYWYFEGINFYGAGDNGVLLAGNNNIFEKCTFEANRDTGLQLSRYDTNAATIDLWPANNLIINCTAFDNCDFPDQGGTGENADGFAAKLTCGEGNVFDGCISYCNSDDGWDLFAKTATGPIGKVTLRNCVAFGNGTLTNGIHYANGDMNGFKLGGSGVGTPHSVFNCLAFNNGACGFTDNNNPSALTVLNCTAYDNAKEDSNKYNFNFGRAKAGLYMNLIASKGAAQSDSFMGAVLNTTYRNSKDFYHVTTKTTFAGKEKLGEKVSDPSSVGAFKNINNTIDVTKSIDSQLRNADGTINMKGLYETTGEYSSMGARYNVKSQVITVALSATSGGNGEETTTVAPTSAPTSAPTQAPTSAPTQAPTSAPTQAPTSAPTQAPTVAPTQAPTEPVKSETLILKSDDVSTGTYTDSFVVKGFVITANSVNSVVVDGNNKTLGSDSFASRIKTGGEGTSAYRTVAFKTNGASTITIAAMSSSSKETRTIQILDKDGNVVSSVDGVGGKTLSAYTLTVPSAGVYYIGSKSSGLNIYKLTVTNAIALTSVSDLGEAPTEAPTEVPTEAPTEAPTSAPTQAPTSAPTVAPTQAPTSAPTVAPTTAPTTAPTQAQTTVSSTEGTTKAGEVGADVDDVTSESKTNITASSEETVSSEEAASTAKAGQVAADTSKTGDSSMAWLYAVIALIACGAIGGTYIVSKKHRA